MANPYESIRKQIAQIFADSKKPVLPDPQLPQIPGYSHIMLDEDTHQITKINREGGIDEEFQPLEIPYVDLKAREYVFQDLMLSKVFRFLSDQYQLNFGRLIQLEILEVSDRGIGFEEMWRYDNIHREVLYLPSYQKWNPDDVHIYIIWRAYYRLLDGKNKETEATKMSDLTVGVDKPNRGSRLTEEGEIKREDGETVLCLPAGCLNKLTISEATDYLAAKSLSLIRLIPSDNGFLIKAPEDDITEEAKKKSAEITASTKEQMELRKKEIDQQCDRLVTDTEGAVCKAADEYVSKLKNLEADAKQLTEQGKAVPKRVAEAANLSIVTTPTGPGVAINAVLAELNNLMSLAAGLSALIVKVDSQVKELELEKYSRKIQEISVIYAAVQSALEIARTAVSLVGKGI